MRTLIPLVGLLGCAPTVPDLPLTVLDRQPDGSYALVAREVPELSDPFHVTGEIASGFRGGAFLADFDAEVDLVYRDGAKLRVRWIEADGALVPADEDGLVMWSFYAHLADAKRELTELGYDLEPIFPVKFAYQPITPIDFLASENAAYILGSRSFVLFPDAFHGVPLAANAGVIRHEFGHAWFELLVMGESGGAWLAPDAATNSVRALNEGFADMVAALLLDDPRFIDPSLPMPSRDLTVDRAATPDLYPNPSDDAVFSGFDPYALGTVYAGFVWSLREATDDRLGTLALVIDAIDAWGAQARDGAAWDDTDRFVQDVLDLADGPTHGIACDAAALHFPDLERVGCPL